MGLKTISPKMISRPWQLLAGALLFIALVICIIVVVISSLDLSVHRKAIAGAFSEFLSKEVVIDGDIETSILPTPTIRLNKLRILNPPNSADGDMASVEAIEARIAILPLLLGRLEISGMTLIKPKFSLEVLADGRKSWEILPAGFAEHTAANSAGKVKVIFKYIRVREGELFFHDFLRGGMLSASNIEAAVKGSKFEVMADLLGGTIKAKGDGYYDFAHKTSVVEIFTEADMSETSRLAELFPFLDARVLPAGKSHLIADLTVQTHNAGTTAAALIRDGTVIAGAPVVGNIQIDVSGDAPNFKADLKTGHLLVSSELAALGQSDNDFPIAMPIPITGALSVKSETMEIGGYKLENPQLDLTIGKHEIGMSNLSAKLDGGQLTFTGKVKQVDGVCCATEAKLALLGSKQKIGEVSGNMDLTMTFSKKVARPGKYREKMQGEGTFTLRDGIAKGLSFSDKGKATTEFRSMTGTVEMEGGEVTLQNISWVEKDGATLRGEAKLDLAKQSFIWDVRGNLSELTEVAPPPSVDEAAVAGILEELGAE